MTVDEEALKLLANATELDEYIDMCSEMGTGDESVVRVPPEVNAEQEKATDNSANLVRKRICVHEHLCMYVCMYTYIYIYIHIYIYIAYV